MKLLYSNFHSGQGIGGHTVYVQRLAQALAPHHEIVIATPASSALYRLGQQIPGVRVHAQNYPNRLSELWQARAQLRRLLREEAFDVVHVNGSSDHRLTLLAGLGVGRQRIVFTKHNDQPIKPLGAWLRARAGTDHVIAVCDHVARRLAESPYRHQGITTIHNGVDTAWFQPGRSAEAQALRSQWLGENEASRLVIGSNAGTDDYKGWIDMVRAAAQLEPAWRERLHIVIAGDPPPEDLLREVDALGMRARFTYAGRFDDVRPMIAALDMGFVLSHQIETISFACREMMAMGKPVVVTRYAGLPENIRDGEDGWVVPVRAPQALAALLGDIVQGKWDLAALGAAARRHSEQDFGLARFVAATEQVYARVLEHPAQRG